MVFTDFVESQLPFTSVVAGLLSSRVLNFSVSGKGETVTETVIICIYSSVVVSIIVVNGETSVVGAIVDVPLRRWKIVSFIIIVVLNLCVVVDPEIGAVVSLNATVPYVSVCVVLEALSTEEKFGSTLVRVDIRSPGGITVPLAVENSFLANVDIEVLFTTVVVCLHSGSLVTGVVSETVDKLENHGDSNLDRVVYLSVITSAVTMASVVIVDSLFVTASGGMIILVAVGKCSILEVLPWNADVIRI